MNIKLITTAYVIVILHANSAYADNTAGNKTSFNNKQSSPSNASFDPQLNDRRKELEDFKLAIKMDSVTAMQDFMRLYPTSPFTEMAQSTVERLQYKDAADKNTVEAFNYYLNEYPESAYAEKATYKRSILIHTINEYDSYLTKFPKGKWRKTILYQRAMLINTVEEFNNILKNVWPNNNNVIYYRDKAALESAKHIGTKDAFKEFIDNYPNSAWIDQAKYFYKYGYDKN